MRAGTLSPLELLLPEATCAFLRWQAQERIRRRLLQLLLEAGPWAGELCPASREEHLSRRGSGPNG